MADLVVTVPKESWTRWIEEGDPADEPESGEEWGFFVSSRPRIEAGERLYVVAWGRVRGYAPVTAVRRVQHPSDPGGRACYAICRKGGAQAVTIFASVGGFRGVRERWWSLEEERPFPEWRTEGVPVAERRAVAP